MQQTYTINMSKKSSELGISRKPRKKRIWVTDEVTRQLKKDFGITGTSVLTALKFFSYSPQALLIREAAIKKMEEVTINNLELMEEFHKPE